MDELANLFPAHRISTDPQMIQQYGKDWTTYFEIKARAVVFPETTDEVVNLVRWARKTKTALVPSGGRTGLSGAAVATQNEVVVSFEKMNRIKDFDSVDHTVVCESGVITENLQKFAESKNLFFPVDFASRGSSQIGGNIATNAGGIKVLRYGLMRDWVSSLKVVTGAGEVLDLNRSLVKNASGYDLRHLFIGSEGTLGFITEATIRLASPPPPLKVLVLGTNELDSVMKIFEKFKRSTTLTAFEMFSSKALKHVLESTQLSAPFETPCPFYVLVEAEMKSDSEESQILSAFESCLEDSLVVDGVMSQSDPQAKQFWRYREDISESLSKYSPYKNDLSVRISKVPAFMQELDAVLAKEYPTWEVVWFGHIGDGNLHINILRPDGMAKDEFVKACRRVDDLVFQVIQKYEGSISAEHGVGLTKKPFLHYSRSASEIALMKSIKSAFDPDLILNPGKVF